MDFLKFLNDTNVYEAKISKSSSRVIVVFENNVPSLETLSQGFVVINKHNQKVMGNYEGFKYLYKKENESSYILSCVENDVYVEPKAKVTFNVNNGGSLEGEKVQEVYNYEELKVPTIKTEENYIFIEWRPEIPKSGKIDGNKTFTAVFEYVPTEEELKAAFNVKKEEKINESKVVLADYLERHPLVSNCHGGKEATYTVTTEKQTLMASNYLTYTIAKESGIENPMLTWNAAGEECEAWTEAEYVTLVLQIAEYVKPLVALQQSYEVQINACETQEELDTIVIVYDVYGASLIPEK